MRSRHFLKSDYSPRSDGATWELKATSALEPGAVPSVHIPSKPHAGVYSEAVKMKVTGGGGVSVVSSAGTGEWRHVPDDGTGPPPVPFTGASGSIQSY